MAVLEVTVVQEAMVVEVDTEEVEALVEAIVTVAMAVVAVAVAEEVEAVEAEDTGEVEAEAEAEDTVVEVPCTFLVRLCSVSD
jgi:hypothetical protein